MVGCLQNTYSVAGCSTYGCSSICDEMQGWCWCTISLRETTENYQICFNLCTYHSLLIPIYDEAGFGSHMMKRCPYTNWPNLGLLENLLVRFPCSVLFESGLFSLDDSTQAEVTATHTFLCFTYTPTNFVVFLPGSSYPYPLLSS